MSDSQYHVFTVGSGVAGQGRASRLKIEGRAGGIVFKALNEANTLLFVSNASTPVMHMCHFANVLGPTVQRSANTVMSDGEL